MRIAGALLLAVGLVVSALLAVFPSHVTVLGTSSVCVMPIVAAFQRPEPHYDPVTQQIVQDISPECRAESFPRLIGAGAVGAISVLVGTLMIGLGGVRTPPTPRPYRG